jgi:transcriptional antiterminator RfaH
MPLLPPEPDSYPPQLFADLNLEAHAGRAWWVLHTKPRQEKSLARQLLQNQVPFYLPLIARRNVIRGRVLHSYVPLFPGYVFLLGSRDERITALTTNRVVQSLEVAAQQELWHDLMQINRLIASGAPVTPEGRLVPGVLVEIRSGPLLGLKGKIMRVASGRRFVVQVDFIQRGASVMLEDCDLVALESAPIAV